MGHGVHKRPKTFKNAFFYTDVVVLLRRVDVNHGLDHGLQKKKEIININSNNEVWRENSVTRHIGDFTFC